MSSALPYQISHGTVGVPVSFPTKTGTRCGHYVSITTSSGKAGYRFLRDPNAVCGLPTAKANVAACAASPSSCAAIPLPTGWSQVGTQAVTGKSPSELYGNVTIR